MQKWFKKSLGLVCLSSLFFSQQVAAEGRLTVYCTVQNALCEKVTTQFGEKYDVKTEFVHGGTETIFGKIKAEKDRQIFGMAAPLSRISKRASWVC